MDQDQESLDKVIRVPPLTPVYVTKSNYRSVIEHRNKNKHFLLIVYADGFEYGTL